MLMVAGGSHRHLFDDDIHQTPPPPPPFHLLEITIISAQDLHPATFRMHAYATTYVHPDHKLRTRTDTAGHTSPTWNDKFVFRVDNSFLRSDTSSVTIQIHAARSLLRNPLVGTVRVILSALHISATTRFVALQVRRPTSLRPQGIINIGVALLDAYIQNMPLYTNPAFALNDLLKGKKDSIPRTAYNDGEDENSIEWKLERNGSVEVGRKVIEQEAKELESKLEKWRIELSPLHTWDRSTNGRGKRRSTKKGSCFCMCRGRN